MSHTSDSLPTSSSLLFRAQQDDATAWERIVKLYAPLVFHWCRGWGLKPHDAENVGQDVFLAVSKNLTGFKRQADATFRGWLWTIARNKYVDFVRKATNSPHSIGGSDALDMLASIEDLATIDEQEVSAERGMLYQRALELIQGEYSERDFQAFYRVTVNGVSAADVASDMGITVNTVYLAKSRILKRLRDEFSDIIDLPAEQ